MGREALGRTRKPLSYGLLKAVLLVLFVAAGLLPATATTFYVDGTNGNDANSGTSPGQAWMSFTKPDSSGVVKPGDTVMVKAGTYDAVSGGVLGFYLTAASGAAGLPITYKADGRAIIVNSYSDASYQHGIGVLVGASYVDFEGFEFKDCLYGLEYFGSANGGTARNCVAYDCDARAFAAVQSRNVTFQNCLAYNCGPGSYIVTIDGCTGTIRLLNNTIDGTNAGGANACVVFYGGSCNGVVKNNIIANATYGVSFNQSAPATIDNSNNIFFNNEFDYLYNVSRKAGEFNANPLWMNAAGGDYSLSAASTAINTGVNVGLAFTGPKPDIGAFESASNLLPGYAVGKVTDAGTGNPLAGARVASLDDANWGITDAEGNYRTLLAPGTYTLKASRPSYSQQTAADVVIQADMETVRNFSLNRVPPQTYYVSDATGSDSNNGLSPGTAWKTIGRGDALGILNPGDTVLIAPGTYPQSSASGLWLKNNSGEAGLPITYKGNGGYAVIDQSAYLGGDALAYGIQTSVSHLKFDSFEVRNCQWGIWLGVEHPGNEVANCYIHDISGQAALGESRALGAWLNTGLYAHNNVIANVSSDTGISTGIALVETSKATIANNTIVNCGTRAILQAGPIPDGGRISVVNNVISGNGRGLEFTDPGQSNGYNVFWNNGQNYAGNGAVAGVREFGADPMLDSSYRLMTGSPAINVGKDVGLPYQGPAPDLGAFETSSTVVPGGVVGTVRANLTGTPPLPLAVVALPGGSVFGVSGPDGAYYVPLPAGTYTLEASATGFQPVSASGINVGAGSLTQRDYLLNKGDWKTYYVDGVNGSDLNSGLSPASAWQNIMFGDLDDVLSPGDTVIVLPGTYYTTGLGNQQLNTGGAPLAPITYKAQGPGVVIDGQGSAFGWVLWTNYVDLDGFEIVNCTYGVDAVNSSNHVISNCTVRDFVNAGLYTYGASNVVFRNNLVRNSTPAGIGLYAEAHTGFAAHNNTVLGCATGVYLLSSPGNASIRNNIIAGNTTGLHVNQLGPVANTNNVYFGNGADYAGSAVPGSAEFGADPMLDGSYKLTAGSPAIDAGINVGLPFNGLAPDLGAFESNFSATPQIVHRIADAKAAAGGGWVTIDVAKAATAASGTFADGSINIEDLDRASGIKVFGVAGVSVGARLTLTGQVGSDPSGEKTLTASTVNVLTTDTPLAALAVNNLALSSTAGVDPTGLLVRTWGTVTFKAADGSYIYIDDGANVDDGTGHAGIRVRISGTSPAIGSIPSVGSFVVVTGLSGLATDGDITIPVIRPRGPADIVTL